MKKFIIGNFGNHSIAALQALLEQQISEIHFLSVDTGWAAEMWAKRVALCQQYAEDHGVMVHMLHSVATFSEMVRDRRQFPSPKFQWCSGFLKGLAISNFLEEQDPSCEALIVSGKRREDSRRYATLEEYEYNHDLYQGRTVWHPLVNLGNEDFKTLILKTGLPYLDHPSLECSPCIHACSQDLQKLDEVSLQRLQTLERKIGKTMLLTQTKDLCQSGMTFQYFERGCGASWGCGE